MTNILKYSWEKCKTCWHCVWCVCAGLNVAASANVRVYFSGVKIGDRRMNDWLSEWVNGMETKIKVQASSNQKRNALALNVIAISRPCSLFGRGWSIQLSSSAFFLSSSFYIAFVSNSIVILYCRQTDITRLFVWARFPRVCLCVYVNVYLLLARLLCTLNECEQWIRLLNHM